jgi:hypothetical protein
MLPLASRAFRFSSCTFSLAIDRTFPSASSRSPIGSYFFQELLASLSCLNITSFPLDDPCPEQTPWAVFGFALSCDWTLLPTFQQVRPLYKKSSAFQIRNFRPFEWNLLLFPSDHLQMARFQFLRNWSASFTSCFPHARKNFPFFRPDHFLSETLVTFSGSISLKTPASSSLAIKFRYTLVNLLLSLSKATPNNSIY